MATLTAGPKQGHVPMPAPESVRRNGEMALRCDRFDQGFVLQGPDRSTFTHDDLYIATSAVRVSLASLCRKSEDLLRFKLPCYAYCAHRALTACFSIAPVL